jgi:alkanesulfonate monooxygenase SsuD/methylene tetrahydromethanopterin reductase-like flavin-dependent oxidoreductase (luciferase family)
MSESNYMRLFGTPEQAAQTLANLFANCNNGFCFAPEPEDATYDAIFELLRSDAE